MLAFQVEQIVPLRDEIMPLLARHWEEIALNKDLVPLDPDWNAYNVMEKSGMVNATVARDTQRRIVALCVLLPDR